MSKWEKIKLKHLTTKIGSGATPTGGQEAYHDSGISLIRSQNVLDFGFSNNGLAFIDEVQARKLSNVAVEEDDILLNITGDSVARVCKVPSNLLPARVNQHVSIIRGDTQKVDSDFLLYFLLNPIFKTHLMRLASDGGTRNALTKSDLENLLILVPSLNEQKSIAAILSCLDCKIENLRKQNETLEAIAQTLFKHWFVDFEFPNEDGKPYKSSGGKMVRSELGEIPAVWNVEKMEDLIEVRDGTHDSPKQTKEGFHLITSKHLKKEGIDFESAYLISESDYIEVNKRSKVDTYDILLSMIGTVGILYLVWEQDINFAIKNIGLFKASKNRDYSEYIFLFLSSEYGKTYFKTRLIGTTQSYLTLSSLREMPLIVPDKAILLGFQQIAKSLFGKSHANNQQIQTLAKTRDVLLPKLMSGNLRITE